MTLIRNKKLAGFSVPAPYSIEELGKHIDPVLLKNLGKIQIDTIKEIQVTVVFWDISGFSSLCKSLNDFPFDIVHFLNLYFAKAIRIIHKYHGVLDKFIGDGILAYFGYNGESENGDPNNALKAALEFKRKFSEIREYFIKYCKEKNGKDASNIKLKCGMHNGAAFLHYFSTPTRNNVIIMGSTVNFASRLEAIAENDEIVISKELKNMIEKKYRYRKIAPKDRLRKEFEKGKIKSYEEENIVYKIMGKKLK